LSACINLMRYREDNISLLHTVLDEVSDCLVE
jgi:hypothetical protein